MNIGDQYKIANNGNCREAIITHFQSWKKKYYSYTTRPAPYDAHMQLITESGFIPFKVQKIGNIWNFDTLLLKNLNSTKKLQLLPEKLYQSQSIYQLTNNLHSTLENDKNNFSSWSQRQRKVFPVGRLTPEEVFEQTKSQQQLSLSSLSSLIIGDQNGDKNSYQTSKNHINPSFSLRNVHFINRFIGNNVDNTLSTSYCVGFYNTLQSCSHPILGKDIRIVQSVSTSDFLKYQSTKSKSKNQYIPNNNCKEYYEEFNSLNTDNIHLSGGVTLITVLWADEFYRGDINDMLNSWCGPKVRYGSTND